MSPGEMRMLTQTELESLVEMLPVDRVQQRELSWQRSSSSTAADAEAAAAEGEPDEATAAVDSDHETVQPQKRHRSGQG